MGSQKDRKRKLREKGQIKDDHPFSICFLSICHSFAICYLYVCSPFAIHLLTFCDPIFHSSFFYPFSIRLLTVSYSFAILTCKLKRFRFLSGKCFCFFFGVFPAIFQNDTRNRLKKNGNFSRKKRNLLSFKIFLNFRIRCRCILPIFSCIFF